MGTSDHTFSQVKAILGKLDRSIDQLRNRRLTPAPVANGTHAAAQAPDRAEPLAPPPSPGGPLRAQPLRPAHRWPEPPAFRR